MSTTSASSAPIKRPRARQTPARCAASTGNTNSSSGAGILRAHAPSRSNGRAKRRGDDRRERDRTTEKSAAKPDGDAGRRPIGCTRSRARSPSRAASRPRRPRAAAPAGGRSRSPAAPRRSGTGIRRAARAARRTPAPRRGRTANRSGIADDTSAVRSKARPLRIVARALRARPASISPANAASGNSRKMPIASDTLLASRNLMTQPHW